MSESAPTVPATDDGDIRMLSALEVCALIGVSRVTVWSLRRKGQFPAGRRLSANRVGWRASEIREWD